MKRIILPAIICSVFVACSSAETKTKDKVEKHDEKAEITKKEEPVEEPEIVKEIDSPSLVAQKFFDYGAEGDIEGLKSVSYWNHPDEISKSEVGEHYVQEVILNFEKDPRMKPFYQKLKKKKITLTNPVEHMFNEERAVAMVSPMNLFVYLGKFDGEWKVLAWNDGFYDGPIQDESEVIRVYQNLIQEAVKKNPGITFSRELKPYM